MNRMLAILIVVSFAFTMLAHAGPLFVGDNDAKNVYDVRGTMSSQNARAFDTRAEALKLHSPITVDGNTSDWLGTPPATNDTGTISMHEYIWNDSVGDDVGATKAAGGYTYPTSVPAGSLDLVEFRVCIDETALNFLMKFRTLVNAGGALNFSHQYVEILIDTNRNGTGRTDTLRNANLALDVQCGWEYAIWLDGFGGCSMIDLAGAQSPVYAFGSEAERCIEARIGLSYFATVPDLSTWQYSVLVGARAISLPDPQYGSSAGFAEVGVTATATTGGGGLAGSSDPNVYDTAFTTVQTAILNTYTTTTNMMITQGVYDLGITLDGTTCEAQSFVATRTAVINQIDIYLKRDTGAPRAVYMSIQENDDRGTPNGNDDVPSGINISSTETNSVNPSPNTYVDILFSFTDPAMVCAGRKYWIVIETEPVAPKNAYVAYWSNSMGTNDRYANGMRATKTVSTGAWTHYPIEDLLFVVSYQNPAISNASANILFAPVYFDKISSIGGPSNEYVSIFFNGTSASSSANLSGWLIADLDGNSIVLGTMTLPAHSWCSVHVGAGTNTTYEVYFARSEMFVDNADEVMLCNPSGVIVDFVSYSDGLSNPGAPPEGAYWMPLSSEPLPPAPMSGQYLQLLGEDNDHYCDWTTGTISVADHLAINTANSAMVMHNFPVSIAVMDSSNNVMTGYSGVVQLFAMLPDGTTNGTGNLSLTSAIVTSGYANFTINYSFLETIRIFARIGAATGISDNITIIPSTLAKIVVEPPALTINAGEGQQFNAYGYDAYDNPVSIPTIVWTTDVGSIFSNGYFTASTVAPISGYVWASVGMLLCQSAVNVVPLELDHLHATPENASVSIDSGLQYSIIGHDMYDNVVDISNATFNWTAERGSLNATGYYHPPNIAGGDNVTVSCMGLSAKAFVNVTHGALVRINITPRPENLTSGLDVQFYAVGYDEYDNLITDIGFNWSTSIGSITSTGLLSVTNQSNVTGFVRASNGSVFDEITVNVSKGGLARIVVYPGTWNMTTDDEKLFFAIGYDIAGNEVEVNLTWNCDGGTIDNGLFRPDRVGPAVVRAIFWPFFGVANINVSIGKIVAMTVAPIGAEITADDTVQFVATGYDADMNSMTLDVNWTVCCGGSISSNGTYDAVEAGTWTVTAQYGNISKSATITVLPGALAMIDVQPYIQTVALGGTIVFSAEGFDADGNAVSIVPQWTVSGGGVISSSGSFHATAAGNWTVTANALDVTGTAIARVYYTTPPPTIFGTIKDQVYPENYGSWVLNLSANMAGNSDPTLKWYVVGENVSIFYVYGENITGVRSLTFVTVPNAYGNTQVRIFLENSEGMRDSETFWVNITHMNRPPVIANIPDLSVHYDETYTFNLTPYISDPDNSMAQLTVTSSDTHVKIEKLGGIFKAIMLFPKAMLGENVPVVFTVSDGQLFSSDAMIINVSSNHPPTLNRTLPDVTMYENSTIKSVFKLCDYFSDQDSEELYYTYGFSHIVVKINLNSSVDITAPVDWYGEEVVTFRAFDVDNGIVEDSVIVTVLPVNDPPSIAGVPNLIVHYDYEYTFDLSPYISDPDNLLSELKLSVIFPNYNPSYSWISSSSNLVVVFKFPQAWLDLDIPVTFTVSDGIAECFQVIYVTVSTDYPPELLRPLGSVTFKEDTILSNAFNLSNYFYDRDNDALIYTYGQRHVNATIHANGSVDFTAEKDWFGVETITFRAIDPFGALVEQSVLVTVIPVPDAPVIRDPPAQSGIAGKMWVLDLEPYITDVDTPMTDISIFVDNLNVKVAGKVLIFNFSKPGRAVVNVRVFDGQLNASTTISVKVSAPVVKTRFDWMPFIIICAFAAVATGFAARFYITSRKKEAIPIVEEAFMVYDDGCLISHISKQDRNEVDDDVLTGMLTAVQEFVKDSFRSEEQWTLRKLEFGQKKILIERGKRIYVAVIYGGEASKELMDKMAEVVSRMEAEHSLELSSWDGKTERLKDARDKLLEIMAVGEESRKRLEKKAAFLPWGRKVADDASQRERARRRRESLVFQKQPGMTNGLGVQSNVPTGIESSSHPEQVGIQPDGAEHTPIDQPAIPPSNGASTGKIDIQMPIAKPELVVSPHVTKEDNKLEKDSERNEIERAVARPTMEYIDESEDSPDDYPVEKVDSFIVLEKGCYFVHGSQKYARKIFENMLAFGAKGLLFTDKPTEIMEELAGQEVRIIWLGKEEGQMDPSDIESLKKIIIGYTKENKGAVVLIEDEKMDDVMAEQLANCAGETKCAVVSSDAKLVLSLPKSIGAGAIEHVCRTAQRLDEI